MEVVKPALRQIADTRDGRRRSARRPVGGRTGKFGFPPSSATPAGLSDRSVFRCAMVNKGSGRQRQAFRQPLLSRLMLQDALDDMRVRDVRRRPPAMTRSLPPQCGYRLRAPQQVNREYTLQWHVTRLSIQDNGAVGTASRSSWLASCTCPSGGVCPRPRRRRGCGPDFGITSARHFAFGAHRRAISRGSGPGSREDVAPTPPARRRTSP